MGHTDLNFTSSYKQTVPKREPELIYSSFQREKENENNKFLIRDLSNV